MRNFVRSLLRPKFSQLWVITSVSWALSVPHIGIWWALGGLLLSAIPVSIVEVLWNDYIDRP